MATDQEIIARASGGLALRGMYVGESDEKVGRKKAVKQLLRAPERCNLMNADQEYKVWSSSCGNIQVSNSFREEVKNFGWSLALSLHGNVYGFEIQEFGAGGGREKSKHISVSSQDMKKEACLMQIWYCPKASFAIPLHQMQLSKEALNDARCVRNSSHADRFLSRYNSHVSTGKYQVGGVLMKSLLMRARTSTSLQQILKKVSNNGNLAAGVDFGLFKVGGKVGFTDEESSSSTDQGASHQGAVEYVYTAVGPRTDEEVEFKTRLDDRSTWDIIDKIDNPDIVPVWEIPSVKNAKDLQLCCDLLREAWQKSVKSIAGNREHNTIYSLLQSSSMEHVRSMLAVSSKSADLTDLKMTLRRVWLETTENLDKSKKIELFHLGEFHHLLDRLAKSTEIDTYNSGRALVRSIITRDEQVWLEGEGIHLSNSVQDLLRNEVEHVIPLPPLEDMSPAGLLDRLKTLLGRRPSAGAGATATTFDPNAVAKAIRNFFRQNLSDGNPVEEVSKLIRVHGFDGNGEVRDWTRVTKEEVNALVDELESMISGIANHTPVREGKKKKKKTSYIPDTFRTIAGYFGNFRSHSVESGPMPSRYSHNLDRNLSFDDFETPSDLTIVYNRHMLVDRPKDISDDLQRQMLDRIKHRLDPFASTSNKLANVSELEDFFADTSINNGDDIHETSERSTPKSSPLSILVELLTNSDLLVQTALLQLLLDARIAIPLVVPLKEWAGQHRDFGHLAEALDFVRVKLARQEIFSIAKDTELPRVVFISNRQSSLRETSQMASKVMNFQLPSEFFKGDTGDGISVIELGVGFLQIPKTDSQDHKPCLVFCVSGDHDRLGEFLAKVADFIIVEMDPSEHASSLPWIGGQSKNHILYWKIDPSHHNHKKEPHWTFLGSFQNIAQDIERYLLQGIVKQNLFKGASEGGATTLEQCLTSIPSLNERTPVFNLSDLDGIKMENAKESLELQKSFTEEAGFYFEQLRQKADGPEFDSKALKLRDARKKLVPKVLTLPLLRAFIEILSLKDYVQRNIGIVNLELNIEKKLQSTLRKAYEKEAQAFQEFQQNGDNRQLEGNYMRARQEHVENKLGLEHLWRELSHTFVANSKLKDFPLIAAQHLIDGFPLEILDGDASMFNSLWVESILAQLNVALSASLKHEPKVFVLSVIGLQSSGKSTLLNIMFGTKLKTSAGQCTRGVYLQLIKSERKEFDYVLILDTEGIRSPEFYSTPNAEAHDNRLATFAVLPADACIVMVANEEDNGLKEVLPMVMLAFKGSAVAEECAGRRQAKLIFAYRSVDTNDISKLGRNQRKLQQDLRSASRDLRNVTNVPGDTLLKDFHVNAKEEESDVKYFGNLKTGNVPPGDTPDWNYGRNVERLREYIHKRVTDDRHWKAYELKSWAKHLKLVWKCITDANFEISFKNQMEYVHFQQLQDKLVACRQKVGKTWMKEFEESEKDLQLKRGTDEGLGRSSDQRFWNDLRIKVQRIVDEIAEDAKDILEESEYQKWKVDELVKWETFCSAQERDWQRRLQDCIDGIFKFDDVVKDYYAKIQLELKNKTRSMRIDMESPNRKKNMKSEFEKIFQRILRQAQSEHPPLAEKVPSRVTRVYESSTIGPKFSFFAEERSDNNSEETSSRSWWPTGRENGNPAAKGRKQKVITILKSTVEGRLCDFNEYADHLVEEMISSTEKLAEKEQLSKKDAREVHDFVKKLLTVKLQTIEEKWDEGHNVSKLLEQRKDVLWRFFQDCANRVDGSKILCTAIYDLFQSKSMDDCFKSKLSSDVSNKLLNEAWARQWIAMRAYLDLHLVELIETSNTDELLLCVRDGTSHYRKVVDTLIETEIHRQVGDDHIWVSFVEAIQHAVETAARRTSVSESSSSKFSEFLRNLNQSINDIGAETLELSKNISNYVNAKVYSKFGDVLDFDNLASEACRGLKTIKPDLTSPSIQAVVELVTKRMIRCATENAGPRCAEMCPHCGLTCFGLMDHRDHHDTLHQPAGLSGMYYEHTRELTHVSCSESVALEERFKNPDRGIKEWKPFADWNKHYPEWKLPTQGNQGTLHVREYIFAHYQEELVKSFSSDHSKDYKICTQIPPRFLLHDIEKLRHEQESIIGL